LKKHKYKTEGNIKIGYFWDRSIKPSEDSNPF